MGILKSRSRRSFIRNMGAGVSAGVASVAGVSGAVAGTADDPARRAARLEEERALRKFHQAFEEAMDEGNHDAVIGMFADDAEVVFNGGIYQRQQGVERLFAGLFPSGKTELGQQIGINAAQGAEKYALKSGGNVKVESLLCLRGVIDLTS